MVIVYDVRGRQEDSVDVSPGTMIRSALGRRRDPGADVQGPLDVYMVGTAYSGTTYLGGLLAANFGALYAGEIGRLPKYVDDYGLFSESVGCLRCAAIAEPCTFWTPDLIHAVERATPPSAMRRLREATDAQVIIDGSKLPGWLQVSLTSRDTGDAQIVVLVTARSPLSYAMSALGATGQPLWLALREWRDIYVDALRTATRTQLPVFVVRNEEIRKDPGTVLDRIAPLLGWPHRVRDVIPAEPTHSIGGNAFVQAGFGAAGHAALALNGLHRDDSVWSPVAFEAAEKAASVGSLQRPANADVARGWAQAAIDCPGLVEIAQTLGYEMQLEFEHLISSAS